MTSIHPHLGPNSKLGLGVEAFGGGRLSCQGPPLWVCGCSSVADKGGIGRKAPKEWLTSGMTQALSLSLSCLPTLHSVFFFLSATAYRQLQLPCASPEETLLLTLLFPCLDSSASRRKVPVISCSRL